MGLGRIGAPELFSKENGTINSPPLHVVDLLEGTLKKFGSRPSSNVVRCAHSLSFPNQARRAYNRENSGESERGTSIFLLPVCQLLPKLAPGRKEQKDFR